MIDSHGRLSGLGKLRLDSCYDLTGSGFRHLAKLEALRELSLEQTDVEEEGGSHLAKLTHLKRGAPSLREKQSSVLAIAVECFGIISWIDIGRSLVLDLKT